MILKTLITFCSILSPQQPESGYKYQRRALLLRCRWIGAFTQRCGGLWTGDQLKWLNTYTGVVQWYYPSCSRTSAGKRDMMIEGSIIVIIIVIIIIIIIIIDAGYVGSSGRHTDRQTHGQTHRQTHGQTDTRTGRHTDGQTHGQTDTRTNRQTHRQTYGQTDTRTDRHTDR